jgi:hypothetical protein
MLPVMSQRVLELIFGSSRHIKLKASFCLKIKHYIMKTFEGVEVQLWHSLPQHLMEMESFMPQPL